MGLLAADAAGRHMHQLEIKALHAQIGMATELEEVVEVGREAKAGGVAGKASAGTDAEKGGLVGRSGAMKQSAAVGSGIQHRGWVKIGGAGQAAGFRVAAATHEQVGRSFWRGVREDGHGLSENRGGGGPVVGAPEKEPVAGLGWIISSGETLVHCAKNARRLWILREPTTPSLLKTTRNQPVFMIQTGRPINKDDSPINKRLALKREQKLRQQEKRIKSGYHNENRSAHARNRNFESAKH